MNAPMRQFSKLVPSRRMIAVSAWVVAALPIAGQLHAQVPRITESAAAVSSTTMDFFPPRVERDHVRDRIWAINRGAVMLYDGRTRTLVKRVVLPDWPYVIDKYNCAPDLAVDSAGNVIVSSNIAPVLWRINAQSHDVQRIDIVLDSDNDKDVGCTGLVSASPETLFAVSAIHGSLWRIDLGSRRGIKLHMATPVRGACALGFANRSNAGPYRGHEGAVPGLLFCESTRHGGKLIEVTGLTQASLLNDS